MKKIALSGGAPVTVATAEEPYGRPFWGPDNMIVWAQSTGIMRVSANGGTPEPVGFEDVGTAVGGLQILPGTLQRRLKAEKTSFQKMRATTTRPGKYSWVRSNQVS